uniref:TSA: Wollemia nobilis Ref_Wollemi_Transcript_7440_2080 transcribed RNA sequence n=1 Tax=Wollemia nobilis TaxID=56998 RepID=A0A0C9S9N2_9CONI
MALSKAGVSVKSNEAVLAFAPALHSTRRRNAPNAARFRCADSARVLGFKGLRVSSQSGLFGGECLRHCVRLGGSRLHSGLLRNKVLAAASQEEPAASDVEVEKVKSELEKKQEETEEAWKQTMDIIKEQASRMQEMSKEAYAVYAEKAKIVLKDATEQLKLQAEKTRGVLAVTAEEIGEKSKQNLSVMIENAPEPVKDIAETAFGAHPEDLKKLTKIHDFCLGIPYGALLFVGGFLSFLFSGSIPAIRFGIILGGIHLALSSASLRAWKKGTSSMTYVKGQAVVALIIFLREMRVVCQRPTLFPGVFMSFISAVLLVFYSFIIWSGGNQLKKAEPEPSD